MGFDNHRMIRTRHYDTTQSALTALKFPCVAVLRGSGISLFVCILMRLFSYCSVLRVFCRDFPDGPEVRTPCLHCRGVPSQVGERRPHKPWTPVLWETVTPVCGLSFQPPETYFKALFLWVDTASEQDILVLNLQQKSNISKGPSHYESSDR